MERGKRDQTPLTADDAGMDRDTMAPPADSLEGLGEGSLYQLLVASVRDYAIFALDADGHIRTWNLGAKRLKGYEESEIIGRHFSVFYPPDDIASGKPAHELIVAAQEERFEDEGWRLRKDGTRFWANVVITALRNENGDLVGFAKVTRDLTERRSAHEQALADARRLAEVDASNQAKSQFLTALSHELRTPLNAIGGYTELLTMGIRGPITEAQRLDLDRIRQSQQHLLSLINDLLNFSRIEAGLLAYDIDTFSLQNAARAIMPMIEPLAISKQLLLRAATCPADVACRADRTKVEQILLNLLSNAVKFTDAGGSITVSCGLTPDRAWMAVRDTGCGIPRDKLESVFEPFVQLGRSLTTAHEGTGLGLSISRDMARGMGGELTVESEAGVGSAFTLSLPRAE